MVSDTISHYRVLKKLGAGGMGEVYLAEDTKLHRHLALKVLLPDYTRDADRLRRFEQEARAASALNHPNILTIYEIGETGEQHYIATEFIDGVTLRSHLRQGRIKLAETLDIALQIASALVAAHQAGIVHRDIKPENIMLRPDGFIKVLDFGLAKLIEKRVDNFSTDQEAPTMPMVNTDPGAVMGTTGYMSPEQVRGLRVDARSDIWSLGIVVYEMVAGRQPFEGTTTSHVNVAIMEREPAPLGEHALERVPAELQRIVGKALAKNTEERYQTVKDMLIDLRRLKQRYDVTAQLGQPLELDRSGEITFSHLKDLAATRATSEPTAETNPTQALRTTPLEKSVRGARRRNMLLAALAFVAVAAGAAGAYFYFGKDAREINAVAVLPFVNAGDDPDTEYLSDGITESLINSLSQVGSLKVMSRNSVFRYKGKDIEPTEIGRALGVGAVLTGRVVRRGEGLSVSVELVDARDNTHIWGAQYNRRMADIIAVQEEISRAISERLRARLAGERQAAATEFNPKRYTENAQAYEAYLRGRYFWNKRNEEGFRKAIGYFKQAIDADPNYALAYAGLADTYSLLSDYSIVSPREAMPKAKAAAVKSLEIDNALAEGHTSLAFVKMAYDWKFAEAEQEFKRAIELNPNYATARQWYASCLLQMGRFDEALIEIRQAQELDPLSLIINANAGFTLYYARQYDRALEQVRKTLDVNPSFGVAHLYLGYIYLEQPGGAPQAIAELQEAAKHMGDDAETQAALGYAYAVAGRRAEAEKILERLNTPPAGAYVSPYFVAIIYTGLGDRERAFERLEQAYNDRHPGMILLKFDPRFNSLRSDPRFPDLVRRIEQEAGDKSL